MAQNITLLGASYSDVPAVQLPKTGGGTARFDDCTVVTAGASDVASGKVFVASDGTVTTGTASGGLPSDGAVLHVYALTGSTITLEKDSIVVATLSASDGHTDTLNNLYSHWYYGISAANYGDWTVEYDCSGITGSKTITIDDAELFTVFFEEQHYLYQTGTYTGVYSHGNLISNGNITDNSGYVQLQSTASRVFDLYVRWVAVDLTPFKRIVCDMTCTSGGSNADSRCDVFVTQESTTTNVRAASVRTIATYTGTSESTHRTVILDVSSLTGYYYVCVGTDSNGSSWTNSRRVRIYSVLLTQN